MNYSAHFSDLAPILNGMRKPCPGYTVGYAAIIKKFSLEIPYPHTIAMVSEKNQRLFNETWKVWPFSYLPEDNKQLTVIQALYNHLVFALKYEGVNLLVFTKLSILHS
jgi:hypothetical protein